VKQILARSTIDKQKLTSKFAGIVTKIDNGFMVIKDQEPRVFEYVFGL
jgi:hypothetical protein